MTKTLKIATILCCLILLFVGLWGCQKYDVEQITLEIYSGDTIDVSVYTITPDLKIVTYVLSNVCFPVDSWPKEYSISQEEWDHIVTVLQNNNFLNLPEDINATDTIVDGGSTYIEVVANGNTHRSGGYMPEYNRSLAGIRFGKVYNAIYDCLD